MKTAVRASKDWGQAPKWIRWGWVLGRMLYRLAFWRRSEDNLLIIHTGSLGDGLLFTGTLREIRRAYPDGRIVLVVSERAFPMLVRCPHVNTVVPLRMSQARRIGRLVTAAALFSRNYGSVLCPDVVEGEDGEPLARLACSPRKLLIDWKTGRRLATEESSPFGNEGQPVPPNLHELERALRFLKLAGFAHVNTVKDIWPESYVGADERALVRGQLAAYRRSMPGAWVVALCAGARFKQKDWGVANYAELLRRLSLVRAVILVPLGSREDRALVQQLGTMLENERRISIINKVGEIGLHASIAYIEQADLCIGNDTFGLHAAIAVGTPSVVLMWGGDGDRWAPWGDPERHRMVRSMDRSCFGCGGKCIRDGYRCMTGISVSTVLGEVLSLPMRQAEPQG